MRYNVSLFLYPNFCKKVTQYVSLRFFRSSQITALKQTYEASIGRYDRLTFLNENKVNNQQASVCRGYCFCSQSWKKTLISAYKRRSRHLTRSDLHIPKGKHYKSIVCNTNCGHTIHVVCFTSCN